ncbi:ABC transporter ATP-binding protein [Indioceanicola profundi]|uniref:ABC transporter ATP-binding protein n=1 Tax=Indioceanicola profundi TaxID=2220096 RepID=UPI000E6AAA78|nr:ABC transporter ATP-binding protein [Indioceanicola profundi]
MVTMGELAAIGVTHGYGSRTVLAGVELRIGPGELVGLIGPNGAGKSSLLRCMAGLAQPRGGKVLLDGQPLDKVPANRRAQRLAYLAQGAEVHWPLTVERLVALGRLPHLGPWSRPDDADTHAIERAMELCDVASLRSRTATTLSGGERARVLLARALAAEPALLLADEPVAGLDPYHQLQVMDVLCARAAAGTGVLMVLHDLTLAARFCSRVALLHQGRVAADGPPGEVLRPGLLEEVYGVRMAAARLDSGETVHLPWEPLARGSGR